jgi:MYXO-CTERM domain-containing protein
VGDINTGVAIYNDGPTMKQSGGGQWMVIGGTSASSPLVAGIFALTGNGAQPPSFAYSRTNAFFDVTTGSNGSCSGLLCHAAAGWDGPTGLGSPNAALLVSQGKPNGQSCSLPGDCQSSNCVASICCDTSCGQQCHACTTGTCSPISSGGCDDGDACTANDTCQNGTCAGTAKSCGSAPGQCMLAPKCDKSTGACLQAQPAPNGTACDDGNLCTGGDICTNGTCGGIAVQCAAPDSCHGPVQCNPATGGCPLPSNYPVLADGTACNDGNPCTLNDSCHGGVCTGTQKSCLSANPCITGMYCNLTSGACEGGSPAPNGTACDDGNRCTQADNCQAGACVGSAIACPAPDQCHSDAQCDSVAGQCPTSFPMKPNGTPCNDNNACTTNDVCTAGVCAGTATSGSCPETACATAGTCDSTSGNCTGSQPKPNGTACDDGDPSTFNDQCLSGRCKGTPANQDPCYGKADGTSCDDANPCTTNDACSGYHCTGTAVSCSAPDQCHVSGTCLAATGKCSYGNKADGNSCDDGDANTNNDVCKSGVCAGTAIGPVKDCTSQPDGTACTGGTCKAGTCSTGTTNPPGGSCGCASGSGPASLLFAMVGIAALRRRRRIIM